MREEIEEVEKALEEAQEFLNILISPMFAKRVSKLYSKFAAELRKERKAFERKEAIGIATAHGRQQSK